ncbi:MAG: hypothetical protein JWO38_7275, partial [Gemmataceae bacterium]|nr:hypothetical protein [Gemmataceae bacterium]
AGVVAPGLAETAVRAAEAVAAGAGVTGLVSAHAVHLCEGVMRMMLLAKLKAAGASALAVLVLTGGLGFGLVPARAGDDPGAPPPAPARGAGAPRPPKPVGPVDDPTFLRRLCLDLTGTLPTPVETGYFAADRDGTKRRKVVDWLLADDTIRAYLAKKLGVPVEQVRVVCVVDPATGRVVRLAGVRPDLSAFTILPDGKTVGGDFQMTGTLDLSIANPVPPDGLFFQKFLNLGTTDTPGANSDGGAAGTVVEPERHFDATYRARVRLVRGQANLRAAGESDPLKTERLDVLIEDQPPVVVSDPVTEAETPLLWAADPPPAAGTTQRFVVRFAAVGDTDADFLGRVTRAARGAGPTALEEKYFLEDKDPKKREKLLDLLLKDPAVAKKVGDDWKKKMLDPPLAGATLDTQPRYTVVRRLQPQIVVREYRIWDTATVPAPPDRMEKLVGELLGAKRTDEQVVEAVTLAAVGRLPTAEEKRVTLAVVATAQDRKAAWVGLAKSLAASEEAKKHAGAANPPAPTPTVPPAKP